MSEDRVNIIILVWVAAVSVVGLLTAMNYRPRKWWRANPGVREAGRPKVIDQAVRLISQVCEKVIRFMIERKEAREAAKDQGPVKPAFSSERVFISDVGAWPRVLKTSGMTAPIFKIKGFYASPGSKKEAYSIGQWVGVVAPVFLIRHGSGPLGLPSDNAVGWIALAVIWLISYKIAPPLVMALLAPFIGASLNMTFDRGMIQWTGNRKKWHRVGFHKETVFANEERIARVVPHTKAADELRKAQELVRRGKKMPRLWYQEASEVFIHTGSMRANWLHVAELADDEQGRKAGSLAAAIMLADSAAQGAEETIRPDIDGPARSGLFS